VPIRLVLADDHPVVLHGLERLFERHDEFCVVTTCQNGNEALEAVRMHQPDILVLDVRMPDRNGIEVLRGLAEEKLACRVVVLTAAMDDAEAVEVLRLGAMGIVGKEAPSATLLECVRNVHQGKMWVNSDTFAAAFTRVARRESAIQVIAERLTPREVEIARSVIQGLRNREVAERFHLSEATVKIHIHNIYQKLGVDSRVGLVLYAQEKGFA
jgi:DNA-binding NarL/FixJ family response regulator